MSNTPTASTRASSYKYCVKIENRGGYTSEKSARKLVRRGQARWLGTLLLHVIEPWEEPPRVCRQPAPVPIQRARLDVSPAPQWEGCYRTLEAITMPIDGTWFKRMGYRLVFGMGDR